MMGVTAACLRICGTEPELREDLIMSTMSGEMAGRLFMMSFDEMGSREQVDVFTPDRMVGNCAEETGENWNKG